MKFRYLVFLVFFSPFVIFGQVDTLHANRMFNQIDKSILIADCDTFNVVFDFSSDQFIDRMPISISRDNNPSLSDYWLNEPTLTITEDAPYWNLKIYVDSTWGTFSSDFLRFRLVDSNNDDDDFIIYFLPEIPYFDVIPLFDEENLVLCEEGNVSFTIEPDTLINNIPYRLDFYDASSEMVLNLFGNELYFEDWWNTLVSPSLDIEIRALNCSQSLASYPVLQNSIGFRDTTACKNDTIDFFWKEVIYPIDFETVDISGVAENGCDSIIRLNIDYLPVDFEVQQIVKTPEEPIPFHDSLVYEFGTYVANSQNFYGCDSSDILSVIPLDALNYLNRIPLQIETYASLCEDDVCIPFYMPDRSDYHYFVNNVPYEFDDLGYCASNPQSITNLRFSTSFLSEGTPFRLENVLINDTSYPDIYFTTFQELINGLNATYPAGQFVKGYDPGEIFSFNSDIAITFLYRNLENYDRAFFSAGASVPSTLLAGLSLPLEEGFNDLRIEHKTYPFVRDIKIFVAPPLVYLDGIERIDYLPELNNKVQFPLTSSLLCGAIVSARSICPEDWEGIVDFSLTDEGILTFEALKPYNSVGCFEICDDLGNCTFVNLHLSFEGERRDLTDFEYNIFPNPASNLVYVTHEPTVKISKINIVDTRGLERKQNIFIHKNVAEIDVSSYEEGLLFFEIYTEDGEVILEKVVIQR